MKRTAIKRRPQPESEPEEKSIRQIARDAVLKAPRRLDRASDIRKMLGSVARLLFRNEIDGERAGKLVYLGNTMLAAIEQDEATTALNGLLAKLQGDLDALSARMEE